MDSRVSMDQITGWASDSLGDRVAYLTPKGWGRQLTVTPRYTRLTDTFGTAILCPKGWDRV